MITFSAQIKNSVPIKEFPDYVLEMTHEDRYESTHLAREFSVNMELRSFLCFI